ncbi:MULTISPECIES: VCBS repeat-containing protein [unclassified Streptomyces]|uniref:FG-GAP repeat domain-containing protein n=1 Tax=unclassified Streptomyces TaxID=2593676 RepID=UPI0006F65F8F|nr:MULTISPECIES: VCBS repeat-containing protein [unclassified Streptomyces]KQX59279.1 hypothetical protein ASD33_03010 [Streptomyces sp. Root1304]KRB00540.1 hypothetical protein ASE09_03010 [Streptomyces sp. Root66D1]
MRLSSSRRRLAAALTVTLAVTLGAGVLTGGPVAAAPVAGASAVAPMSIQLRPSIDDVVAANATGFVSHRGTGFEADYQGDYAWTRYSDGVARPISGITPADRVYAAGLTGDLLALHPSGTALLRNMATGKDLQNLPESQYAGAAGSSLFASVAGAQQGTVTLQMLVGEGEGVTRRPVTGLPADTSSARILPYALPGQAAVAYTAGTGADATSHVGVLDLASGAVTKTYAQPAGSYLAAFSATRLAWFDTTAKTVTVTDRTTGATTAIPLPGGSATMSFAFVGDWLVRAVPGGLQSLEPNPYHALTAYHLPSGTTRKLLDHITSMAVGPDGLPVVRGGSVATNEGYFRIAPGTDGVPAATLRKALGEKTAVGLRGTVPTTLNADLGSYALNLFWPLTRGNVEGTVTLRHTLTGKTYTHKAIPDLPYHTPGFSYQWSEELATGPAPAGAYTWTLSARPLNGIGPVLNTSGAFTVLRRTQPHDFNNNGTPDVLTRDAEGRLWRQDTFYRPDEDTRQNVWKVAPRALVGTGWQAYDRIEATGNLGGSGVGDVVGRDKYGVLWLHKGRGDGTFANRIRVGTGWGTYSLLTGGSDVTGDGRPDLLGTDKAGVLWVHPGTGKDTAPFGARRKVSAGWGIYNDITAVGNVGGAGHGDFLAREKSGAVWLFLGKGDGTFVGRYRIGTIANDRRLVGLGDANGDGRNDLLEFDRYNGGYLKTGTGQWTAPFQAADSAPFGTVPYDSVV